ncbi:hypothetical protein CAOG_07711 [Capsaspora owczarzaki ATCC 30864]|uniref:Uncharacterized protein n=1 Tax=Capsaspora owczarzaki (strain ATCC 30864) TaxID=595528 RepID=A0A0D2WWC8_CAPO3|nr:hypothetical protein CAOG_07711 [Capsaspora owczarzaki ATCC 30864]KJE97275.1 hypothetical protein CAOG_007711 [Capsaspora owczarzaki ATCC 30864]|eukprot:XP_004343585.1 hypothetical protein CAOG_07711 [Capsaspora owczarzaki ATCC 30864]
MEQQETQTDDQADARSHEDPAPDDAAAHQADDEDMQPAAAAASAPARKRGRPPKKRRGGTGVDGSAAPSAEPGPARAASISAVRSRAAAAATTAEATGSGSAADVSPEFKDLRALLAHAERLAASVTNTAGLVANESILLREYVTERDALLEERASRLRDVAEITEDYEAINAGLQQLVDERDQLRAEINRLQTHIYTPLKDRIDQVRLQAGMAKLPTLQDEHDARVSEYLQQRRSGAIL